MYEYSAYDSTLQQRFTLVSNGNSAEMEKLHLEDGGTMKQKNCRSVANFVEQDCLLTLDALLLLPLHCPTQSPLAARGH